MPLPRFDHPAGPTDDLVARLARDIRACGYSVCMDALPPWLVGDLLAQVRAASGGFARAGIGRQQEHQLNQFVRRDQIRWIEGRSAAEQQWLAWAEQLRLGLKRELLLGLFDFESHFAHYPPGAFYRRHLDSFNTHAPSLRPGGQRVLSLVAYLNPGWGPEDGGELVIYENEQPVRQVTPLAGSIVCFLSEEVPHEVLPAHRDRYSIAGWFRLNGSTGALVDPPR